MMKFKNALRSACAALIIALILLLAVGAFCGLGPTAYAANEAADCTVSPALFTVWIGEASYPLPAYLVNGEPVFKLRGLARLLDGTNARFSVEWADAEHTVYIGTGKAYLPVGGELTLPSDTPAAAPGSVILVDGEALAGEVWLIGGNNYLSPDGLGDAAGCTVSVDVEARTVALSGVYRQEEENNGCFTLSLIAGESEALLNGEVVCLSAAPFVEDEAFFFPLEDVAELLGGSYSFDGRLARVELFGDTLAYELGAPALTCNGERWEIAMRESFSARLPYVPADGDFAPRLKDGVLFIPASFRAPDAPVPVLSGGRSYPEEGLVILGGFQNELGTREVRLDDFYDLLPESLRSGAVCAGAVGRVLNYEVRLYRAEDLEIYVMYDGSGEDPERMDGRVCALRILGGSCATPRGLRVGDGERKPELLYGPYYSTDFAPYGMKAEFENGAVVSILFYSRYYGSDK